MIVDISTIMEEINYNLAGPPYNRNMYFYIMPIIELLKMVTLCDMNSLEANQIRSLISFW